MVDKMIEAGTVTEYEQVLFLLLLLERQEKFERSLEVWKGIMSLLCCVGGRFVVVVRSSKADAHAAYCFLNSQSGGGPVSPPVQRGRRPLPRPSRSQRAPRPRPDRQRHLPPRHHPRLIRLGLLCRVRPFFFFFFFFFFGLIVCCRFSLVFHLI